MSAETRQRAPGIPWPLITGMRNIVAHEYGTVALDKVYEVVTDHVPDLLVRLAPLIASLEQDVGWPKDDDSGE